MKHTNRQYDDGIWRRGYTHLHIAVVCQLCARHVKIYNNEQPLVHHHSSCLKENESDSHTMKHTNRQYDDGIWCRGYTHLHIAVVCQLCVKCDGVIHTCVFVDECVFCISDGVCVCECDDVWCLRK